MHSVPGQPSHGRVQAVFGCSRCRISALENYCNRAPLQVTHPDESQANQTDRRDSLRDDRAWSLLSRKHTHHHHHHGKLKRGRKAKTISHIEVDDDAGDVRKSESATKPGSANITQHSRHGRSGGEAYWKTIAKATKEPAYKGPWVSGTRQPDWIERLKWGPIATQIDFCGNSTGVVGHQTYHKWNIILCTRMPLKLEAVRVRQLCLSPFRRGLVQPEPEKRCPQTIVGQFWKYFL